MIKMHFNHEDGTCKITMSGSRIEVLTELTTVTSEAFKRIVEDGTPEHKDRLYNTFMQALSFAIYEEDDDNE